jgi:hypothetical protein
VNAFIAASYKLWLGFSLDPVIITAGIYLAEFCIFAYTFDQLGYTLFFRRENVPEYKGISSQDLVQKYRSKHPEAKTE